MVLHETFIPESRKEETSKDGGSGAVRETFDDYEVINGVLHGILTEGILQKGDRFRGKGLGLLGSGWIQAGACIGLESEEIARPVPGSCLGAGYWQHIRGNGTVYVVKPRTPKFTCLAHEIAERVIDGKTARGRYMSDRYTSENVGRYFGPAQEGGHWIGIAQETRSSHQKLDVAPVQTQLCGCGKHSFLVGADPYGAHRLWMHFKEHLFKGVGSVAGLGPQVEAFQNMTPQPMLADLDHDHWLADAPTEDAAERFLAAFEEARK